MRIVIAGAGKIGERLIEELTTKGNNIVFIDNDADIIATLTERFDVMAVQGNCASLPVLENAGIKKADLLLAVTNSDEVNLLSCFTAHIANPNLHTIARVRNIEYSEQIQEMWDDLGLSLYINPDEQAAKEIERLLRRPGFSKRETFAKGRVEIVELKIDENSKLLNKHLKDLNGLLKCAFLVCAVLRDGKILIPKGDFIFEEGDKIYVTARQEALLTMLKNLGIVTRKVRHVFITGGGIVTRYLAKRLNANGIKTTIVERDRDKCLRLAEELPDSRIIHGNACKTEVLESNGISDADAFVAVTGIDEQNIMTSLTAKSKNVQQVVIKVSHNDHTSAINELSIGSVVCPKEIAADIIVQYVGAMKNQSGAAIAIHSIADGYADAIEFPINDTTKYCNTPLKDIKLIPNAIISCINSGANTYIPNGDSVYKKGDTVVVVTSKDTVLEQLNDIFE